MLVTVVQYITQILHKHLEIEFTCVSEIVYSPRPGQRMLQTRHTAARGLGMRGMESLRVASLSPTLCFTSTVLWITTEACCPDPVVWLVDTAVL